MSPRDPAPTDSGGLDPAASIGVIALTVADLARSRRFYTDTLGMSDLGGSATAPLTLGTADGCALLELVEVPRAAPRDPHQTGLFHFAVLVPTRTDLARALFALARAQWPLTGASDHLVSEALYLQDPDGNGIEIYRDRPRTEWPQDAHGHIQMDTLALDLDALISEIGPEAARDQAPRAARGPHRLANGTRIGHVHLQVAELSAVEAFYHQILGFDVTVRSYPGALFVSAGGYHHHVGLNTWNSRGAAAPAPGSIGLRHWELKTGSVAGRDALLVRAQRAGLSFEEEHGAPLLSDPSGNRVRLVV